MGIRGAADRGSTASVANPRQAFGNWGHDAESGKCFKNCCSHRCGKNDGGALLCKGATFQDFLLADEGTWLFPQGLIRL